MLIPLKQWICDTCGEIIELPEHGWLEWRQDERHKAFDFKIVHHVTYSPRGPHGNCYQSNELHNHLTRFVGEDGLPHLLCLLDEGVHIGLGPDCHSCPQVKDIGEWMELIRRLQVPYYEEARQYFDGACEDGHFDGEYGNIFRPKELKYIIDKYGTQPVSDL